MEGELAEMTSESLSNRYAVTRDQLQAWRSAGESMRTIASRYGCRPQTVGDWLDKAGLDRRELIQPSDAPPGKQPRAKRTETECETRPKRISPATPLPRYIPLHVETEPQHRSEAEPEIPSPDAPPADIPDIRDWPGRVRYAIETARWDSIWGPTPNEVGCFMPESERERLSHLIQQLPDQLEMV